MDKQIQYIANNLDFSGGPDSWFDYWHTHLDWHGDGNNNWEQRKKYLDGHFKLFKLLCEKLKNYPHPFQVWIDIDERDSAQDAVYIHTNNPNDEGNFPTSFKKYETPEFKDKNLKEYLKTNLGSLSFKGTKTYDEKGNYLGNAFFIYDKVVLCREICFD